MNKLILATSVLSVLVLAGCTTTRKPVPTSNTSDSFIQQEMSQSVQSIQRDLKVLVDLTKGDVAPRHPTAIGTTVAGASSAKPAPLEPAPVLHAQQKADAEKALQTRIRIQWTGPADALMRDLGKSVKFSVHNHVKGALPVVTIKAENLTVLDVMSRVSNQLPKHRFEVKTSDSSIHLFDKP